MYLEVHPIRCAQDSTVHDTFVAIKVTQKCIPDQNRFSHFYREKTVDGEEPVPERSKAEIFALEKLKFAA